jgi:branched-chain amino acid transport system substrate-binding protein
MLARNPGPLDNTCIRGPDVPRRSKEITVKHSTPFRPLGVAIALAAIALSATACSPSPSVPDGEPGGTIALASAAPLASPMFQIPQYQAGMEAAVASINAAGGVGGKQLSLDFCDTGFSVNGEVGCARTAVADGAAAVIAPIFFLDQAGTTWDSLEAAGIPVVGALGGSPVELAKPNIYPLGAGGPGVTFGCVAAALDAGATELRMVIDTTPTAGFFEGLTQAAFASAGIEALETVVADATSDPTYATAASKAIADGTDGIIVAGAPPETVKLIGALRSAGYEGIISVQSGIPTVAFEALGDAAEGILVTGLSVSPATTDNPGIAAFLADMEKYQPDADIDDWTVQGWTAVRLFAAGAADAESFDPAGIIAALDAFSTPVELGTIGPWAVADRTSPLPDFPRILNPEVAIGVIEGGVIKDSGEFVNPFTALSDR